MPLCRLWDVMSYVKDIMSNVIFCTSQTHLCHPPNRLDNDEVTIGQVWRPMVPSKHKSAIWNAVNGFADWWWRSPHVRCEICHHVAKRVERAKWKLKSEMLSTDFEQDRDLSLHLTCIRKPPIRASTPRQGMLRVFVTRPSIVTRLSISLISCWSRSFKTWTFGNYW